MVSGSVIIAKPNTCHFPNKIGKISSLFFKNRLQISAKIGHFWANLPRNSHEIGYFYGLLFSEICPKICHEIDSCFHKFAAENPRKFDFFLLEVSYKSFWDRPGL